jgi:expansin (peptidoglycan-binding protein)
MKITATKIKRELEKNHGWINLDDKDENYTLINQLIKDTLKVVDKILIEQKGISIK